MSAIRIVSSAEKSDGDKSAVRLGRYAPKHGARVTLEAGDPEEEEEEEDG